MPIRNRDAYAGLPEPDGELYYDTELVVYLGRAPWRAVVDFNAEPEGDGCRILEMDVMIEPADLAFACRPYRIDVTEFPNIYDQVHDACVAEFFHQQGDSSDE